MTIKKRPFSAKYVLALVCLVALSGLIFAESEVLFEDNFVASTIGKDWTITDDPAPSGPSAWSVSNGKLLQKSNIYRTEREYEFWQGTNITAGSSSWTDYELSAEISAVDDDGLGAIVRYIDNNNYYRFIMLQDAANGGPFRRLEKFVNGERVLLAESKEGFISGHEYKLQFIAFGDCLEVWLDGKKVLEAQDSEHKSGKIGFMSYATDSLTIGRVKVKKTEGLPSSLSEAQQVFDMKNFRVKDPTGTTATLTWSGNIAQASLNVYVRDTEEKTPIVFTGEEINAGTAVIGGLKPYTDYVIEVILNDEVSTRRFRTRKLQITRGPYLSMANPGEVTVAWGSLDEIEGKVIFWREDNPEQKTEVKADSKKINDGFQYSAKLTGLAAQTHYSYVVEMVGANITTDPVTFVSAPDTMDSTFTFNVYGDTQNLARHREVITAMNKEKNIAFLLHQGDIVNAPTASEYASFFSAAGPLIARVPFYPIRGNHDAQHFTFNDYFELPGIEDYYSFVYGPVYVIAINTPGSFLPGSAQYEWIKKDLEAHKDMPYKIAFTHYCAYSPTAGDNNLDVRRYLSPLFEEYGIQVVFSGHSHVYDHYYYGDVHYVITGGGGGWELTYETSKYNAPFNYVQVHVNPEKMVIEGLKPNGELIEVFEVMSSK